MPAALLVDGDRMPSVQPPGPAWTVRRDQISTRFALGLNPLLSTVKNVSNVNIRLQATSHINKDRCCIVNLDGSFPTSQVYHQAMVAAKLH